MKFECAIFDLDGVLVDTAKFHYYAWKELANRLEFDLSEQQNEQLKGTSRMDSLNNLLKIGGRENDFNSVQKMEMAEWKNTRYVKYISQMDSSEVLEGVIPLLQKLKQNGVKITIGSASKNAPLIIQKVGIQSYFDIIIDGNCITKAKPDPEVFMLSADRLGLPYSKCAVFEDSETGLQASSSAGMFGIGIGKKENLLSANVVYPDLTNVNIPKFFNID